MRVPVWRHYVGGTHDQAPMPDSLCAEQFVRQLLNITGLAAQQHYFKACIVIQMRMQRRNHSIVMFVLQIGQFFG